jgi:small subunit ribosomal protein S17
MADDKTVDEEIEQAEEQMEAEGSPVDTPVDEAAPAEPVADTPTDTEDTAVAEPDASEQADAPDTNAGAPEEEPVSVPNAASAPVEIVHPKARRRSARQRSSEGPRETRTPEQRKAERDAVRAKNAKARTLRRGKVRAKKPAAAPVAAVEAPEPERGAQKVRQGIVVSDKAAKTITVRIDTSRRHRRYQKIVRSSKTLHAHDENNEAHEGDLVRVIETRPLSATKRWRLAEVVERAR